MVEATVVEGAADEENIVTQVKNLLKKATPEELAELREQGVVLTPEEARAVQPLVEMREKGVQLIDAEVGSIRLCFSCRDDKSLTALKTWMENGQLLEFLLISLMTPRVSLEFKCDEEQFNNGMLYFKHKTQLQGKSC